METFAQQVYRQLTVLDSCFPYKFKTFICVFFFLLHAAGPHELLSHISFVQTSCAEHFPSKNQIQLTIEYIPTRRVQLLPNLKYSSIRYPSLAAGGVMKQQNTFPINNRFNNLFKRKCIKASQAFLAAPSLLSQPILPAGFLSETALKMRFCLFLASSMFMFCQ